MSDSGLLRNFSIIAHIDHGKTTLTDRILEFCGQVDLAHPHDRLLDSNPIERERGITIKLAPVRLPYTAPDGTTHTLNLIDTPGHVDFGYEVSRSLAACEGVLMVVDASQGIQAQTLSTYYKAKALGLTIVPVINKIDLPSAETDRVLLEVMELCEVDESEILLVSAKTGVGIQALLQAVVERIPAPNGDKQAPLRALLISSYFDQHQGAVALVRVVDGVLDKQRLTFLSSPVTFMPLELGVYQPKRSTVAQLGPGEVGYVVTGLKDVRSLKVGDTLTTVAQRTKAIALTGYQEPQPLVFFELFPTVAEDYNALLDALQKLALRDAAISFVSTHSPALGSGSRIGCLGLLHAEIVVERLQREFDLDLIATRPTVPYKAVLKDGSEKTISTINEFPDPSQLEKVSEPVTKLTLITPVTYMSGILDLVRERRGQFLQSEHLIDRVILSCSLPLSELITDFHDLVKSLSSGYCSVEYEVVGEVAVDAVVVTILLNGEEVSPLGFIAIRSQAEAKGRALVKQLKETLPRQLFAVAIQATIGGTVIARETQSALRKDVTAKLYGGDVTRRKKLLAKQAKGKKRMKQFGSVSLDQDVFLKLMRQPLV
ncbi:MAG: elongation factor 4 [Candidatus Pacebacteria bacterium]|nr:elongation factor 4 [Candidatus Paceibacterota bacterium]PIR59972.1 MAG: elongation factor 4 [Candidatus Pacebacteria bacterium CG10_big_fil_rev_8_21_14_0_10_44_54]